MRRGVPLVLVLAGCGRLGFDNATPRGDAASDGSFDGSTDAAPCGGAWCLEQSTVPDDLSGLFGFSAGDLWTAGGGGTIVHRDVTGQWTQVASGVSTNLHRIWGATPTDVWAFGTIDAAHWDGSSWTQRVVGNADLFGAWGFGANDIWVVGNAPAYATHWSGATWTSFTLPGSITELYSVWGAATNDVWAGGLDGQLVHYDGVSWTAAQSNTIRTIYGLHGLAANDIWAAASYGATLHYDGAVWTEIGTPVTMDLAAIFEVSPTEVWAVGGTGTLLRWDGSAWHVVDSGTTQYLEGLWGVGSSVFAVGAVGTVLREP